MKPELEGRRAFVSGGSRGIGFAAAAKLAGAGAEVVICARDAGNLEKAAEEIAESTGGVVHSVPGDLSTSAGVDEVIAATLSVLGGVDVLVNVAGVSRPGRIHELTDEHWRMAIDVKLMGYIRTMRAFLPGMVERRFGRVINVAGTSGKQPDYWVLAAGTVNAAVIALSKGVSLEVAAKNVTVNVVCPGPTATSRWRGMQVAYARVAGVSEEQAAEHVLAGIPSGRIATPDDVAQAVIFFASPSAAHVTGTTLMIDGGQVRGL